MVLLILGRAFAMLIALTSQVTSPEGQLKTTACARTGLSKIKDIAVIIMVLAKREWYMVPLLPMALSS
jgi:hypothetical protein